MSLKNLLIIMTTLIPTGLFSGPSPCQSATLASPPVVAAPSTTPSTTPSTRDADASPATQQDSSSVRVLSQNLYIGINVADIVEPSTLFNLPAKASAMYEAIQKSGYRDRLFAFAQVIVHQQPDIIALQEVSQFLRQSPSNFYHKSQVHGHHKVEIDYLSILLDELAARGVHYKAAVINQNAAVEFPIYHHVGPYIRSDDLDDIMMIDRDVILTKDELPIKNTYQNTYANVLKSPIRNKAIGKIKRGFQMLTTSIGGHAFHLVNTHLEVRTPAPFVNYQYLQAKELATYLAGLKLPTLVAGDFNDAPNGFRRSPYRVIRSQQFADSWVRLDQQHAEPGFTCCHRDDLRNPTSELSRRIDYIYFRNMPNQAFLRPHHAELVNHLPEHKTSSGLWYSDHAGVVMTFTLTPPSKV